MKKFFATMFLCIAISSVLLSEENPPVPQEPESLKIPLGLPPIEWPADNPYSQKKAELGRILYFDKRLSGDGTVSCATCHTIPRAFSDEQKISIGIKGQKGTRHAPTVINAAYQKNYFWDGRALTLEDQCKGPLSNPKEMALAKDVHVAYKNCHTRIKDIVGYRKLFKEAFGSEECSIDEIVKAIATFERTILSGNSPFDKYMAGDKSAMTEEQIYGYSLYKKTGCINCHSGPNFTDGRFLNIGIGMDEPNPDLGRYEITKLKSDWGSFKVPTLRETQYTYPYMHDGSLETLDDVIDYYDRGGNKNQNLHPLMRPLHLTEKDKKALHSFLHALSGEGWHHFKEPTKFPE
jgi:cytochrome c peroxidase